MKHGAGRPSIEIDLARERTIAAAVRVIRATGLDGIGYFDVARAAQLEVWVIKELFPEWDTLVLAAAEYWHGAARRQSRDIAETRGAAAYFRSLLRLGQLDPSMMRLRISLMSTACSPTASTAERIREQYAQFMQDAALFLTRDMIAGREPRSMAPRHAAKQLVSLYDGLHLQFLLGATPDLLDVWDRAVARMRAGWSTEYGSDS